MGLKQWHEWDVYAPGTCENFGADGKEEKCDGCDAVIDSKKEHIFMSPDGETFCVACGANSFREALSEAREVIPQLENALRVVGGQVEVTLSELDKIRKQWEEKYKDMSDPGDHRVMRFADEAITGIALALKAKSLPEEDEQVERTRQTMISGMEVTKRSTSEDGKALFQVYYLGNEGIKLARVKVGDKAKKGEGNDLGRESEKAEETQRERETPQAGEEKAKPEGEEGKREVQPDAEGDDHPTDDELSEAQDLLAKLNEIYVAADNLHDKINELETMADVDIPEWLDEHEYGDGSSMKYYIQDQLVEAESASDDLMDGAKNLAGELEEFLGEFEGE